MGNTSSHTSSSNNIFEKELEKLNKIVNDVISDKDIFKNGSYNFLSENVCNNYQIVLEEELSKHLKLNIKELGTSLYIIPKNEDINAKEKLTKLNLTKKVICEKISNHYIKILYVMCLIKYVYNLEKAGDLSIAGIVFRNIKIVDDMMQITFCGLPHKKYTNAGKDAHKIDLSELAGMKFFTEYFLTPEESGTFIGILREVLKRSGSTKVKTEMCHYISTHGAKDTSVLESLYESRFKKEKLTCAAQKGGSANLSLFLEIEKDNPVFLSDYCGAPMKLAIKLNTPSGQKLSTYYKQMHSNYKKSIEDIHKLLDKLVYKNSTQYELSDIDKSALDVIINEIKIKIKAFYIQSIFDYQNLLDMAKATSSIHIT